MKKAEKNRMKETPPNLSSIQEVACVSSEPANSSLTIEEASIEIPSNKKRRKITDNATKQSKID